MSLPAPKEPTAIERGYVRLAACRDDGARVRAVWAADRQAAITDIEYFELI